jgi:ribosomal peptide maturation radical SAM protein 1
MRVLLVNMPFANLRWPSLALGLLKEALRREGIYCDVAYLNFDFAEQVGLELYHWIADGFAFVLGGERLFARELFGRQLPDDDQYWHDVLLWADPRLTEEDRRDYLRVAAEVRSFLDGCVAAIDWSRYDVVGFTASFQQTLASLCLAERLKRIRPTAKVCLGGAACQGPMGMALMRHFPQLDYVFFGEADTAFPQLAAQLARGGIRRLPPGVAGRENIAASADEPPDSLPLVTDLDSLPYPDFDDYFARLERSPLRGQIEPMLFFETSRGCWWGEKHQCAFCGLNGAQLCFRSKSPARAFAELEYLATRYGVRKVNTADNILDLRYLDTLMPQIADSRLGLEFVYEFKTNLDRREVERLLRAGLPAAQLGVETFSTAILRQIRKGATAAQNIQALKWFSAAGIEVK